MDLTKEELLTIKGGAWSAALVNATVKGFEFLYNLGKYVGTTISRVWSKNLC